MKKLLCLLLSLVLVLSFAACAAEEEEYDFEEVTSITVQERPLNVEYKDAVHLLIKTFSGDFTKEELKAMYPAQCWTYFKEVKGMTLDAIYEDFNGRMQVRWEGIKETTGEDAAVRYEFEELLDCFGDDYVALKAELTERYGFAETSFGTCYQVRLKIATMGSLKEESHSQYYHVLEIDGAWYVAEILTQMPVIA